MSYSLEPHGPYSPWNSPGQNTGVGSLSLLQGIFATQGLSPGLPHCRRLLYQLSRKRCPRTVEWVVYSFSRGYSWPGNQTRVSCIAGRFPTNGATREAKNLQRLIHLEENSMTPDTHLLSFVDHLQVPNWFLSYNLPALPSAKHAHQWHSQISANTTFLEVFPRHLTERGHHLTLPSPCSICSTVPITSWNPLFKYLSLSLEQKLHENKHLHFGVPKHSESRPKAPCTYLLNEGMKPKCMGSFWWTKITPVNIKDMVSAQCLWRSATAGLSEGHTLSFALPAFSYRCTANIYGAPSPHWKHTAELKSL